MREGRFVESRDATDTASRELGALLVPLLFNRRNAASAAASLGLVSERPSLFEFDSVDCAGDEAEAEAEIAGCSEVEGRGAGTAGVDRVLFPVPRSGGGRIFCRSAGPGQRCQTPSGPGNPGNGGVGCKGSGGSCWGCRFLGIWY
jgi:hypothetical protein